MLPPLPLRFKLLILVLSGFIRGQFFDRRRPGSGPDELLLPLKQILGVCNEFLSQRLDGLIQETELFTVLLKFGSGFQNRKPGIRLAQPTSGGAEQFSRIPYPCRNGRGILPRASLRSIRQQHFDFSGRPDELPECRTTATSRNVSPSHHSFQLADSRYMERSEEHTSELQSPDHLVC